MDEEDPGQVMLNRLPCSGVADWDMLDLERCSTSLTEWKAEDTQHKNLSNWIQNNCLQTEFEILKWFLWIHSLVTNVNDRETGQGQNQDSLLLRRRQGRNKNRQNSSSQGFPVIHRNTGWSACCVDTAQSSREWMLLGRLKKRTAQVRVRTVD